MAAFVPLRPNKYCHVTASNGIVLSSPYTPLAIMTASPIASVGVFETSAMRMSARYVRCAPSAVDDISRETLAGATLAARRRRRQNETSPPRFRAVNLASDHNRGAKRFGHVAPHGRPCWHQPCPQMINKQAIDLQAAYPCRPGGSATVRRWLARVCASSVAAKRGRQLTKALTTQFLQCQYCGF